MKKLKYILLMFLFIPNLVLAENRFDEMNITINLDSNGNAHIVEVWDLEGTEGTEVYKAIQNLDNNTITNFQVRDEHNRLYTFVDNWNINASIEEKAYKNGFNYINNGIELCWGLSSYGEHEYTISYDISNFVFNTSDAQVAYWTIINPDDMIPEEFSIVVTGPTKFSDTLDVWGYGYKGYAYVSNGNIEFANYDNSNLSKGDYATVLIKFPLNTFSTNNTYSKLSTFDDVLDEAEKGTFDYNYDDNSNTLINKLLNFVRVFIYIIFPIGIFFVSFFIKASRGYKYEKAGRIINMKEINYFREIPCDKNVYRAYFLAQAYYLNVNYLDFIGTLFLKWIFEDKIEMKKETVKKLIGSKEELTIIFKDNVVFEYEIEREFYELIKEASKDCVLNKRELENWSKLNYQKIETSMKNFEHLGRDLYLNEDKVYKTGSRYTIKDELKEEAIKLAGLKKYLKEFSRIKEKQPLEVKLWKEYLMYAQIFGIADEVAKQFKELYPEVLVETGNYDLTDIIIINSIVNSSVVNAVSARQAAASSYSGGGGGFSSGGGGGGSFGGGGSGIR